MSKATLLLFSIGPVQEFIAAGRKTRDLFAGSQMLSHLSAKAIEAFLAKGKDIGASVEVIFPSVKLGFTTTMRSVPNRFLADVSGVEDKTIRLLAEAAKDAALGEFKRIADFNFLPADLHREVKGSHCTEKISRSSFLRQRQYVHNNFF